MYIHRILTPHTPITVRIAGTSDIPNPRKLIDKFIKNKSRQNHKDFVYFLILSPNFF